MGKKRKSHSYVEYWPLFLVLVGFGAIVAYIAYDSVAPRSDDWCRGLRKGYYAGSMDRREYLSEEFDVQVGFERTYLGPSDKLYMERKAFQDGYKRGYRQGYQYTDTRKVQHLEDTARCDPNYMYLGMKRGYTY